MIHIDTVMVLQLLHNNILKCSEQNLIANGILNFLHHGKPKQASHAPKTPVNMGTETIISISDHLPESTL